MSILTRVTIAPAHLGLLVGRVALGGIMFYHHGLGKITTPEKWEGLGANMNQLGVHFLPEMWGFLAAFAEGICSILLVLGLITRPAALMLMFTMFIAYLHHTAGGDPWSQREHALVFLIGFAIIFISGPGKYSIDSRL